MNVSTGQLSRAVSHALRHEPWLYELELDDEGWARVGQLALALREKGGSWAFVDRHAIELMINSSPKQRHELVGNRIRALYGHSTPNMIERRPARPPTQLFHGTSPWSWDEIRADGLRPMGRQYVHMSTDVKTALAVGQRKSSVPVVLYVDAAEAAAADVAFFKGNEKVWLAMYVPPEFVHPH